MSVIKLNGVPHNTRDMFLDGSVGIQRYDNVRYPFFDKLVEQQSGFFWRPQEVDCHKDAADFKTLTPHEQHIFTSNIKRQIVLDTVQGRAPSDVFGPIVSLPEVEAWITTWTFFETIHSRSYSHIIKNVYPNPQDVFDQITEIRPIIECAKAISAHYDRLKRLETLTWEYPGEYDHKRAIWAALNSVNALEGVRFYVSFACSWAFAELKKMEGNAKIIKMIARDENLHLAGTQQMIRVLQRDDADFAQIARHDEDIVTEIFTDVVEQEKQWAEYLFQHGSMIGLNAEILVRYVEWIASKRMQAIGLKSPYVGGANPLPWTEKWITGANVQVAPQEVEATTYIKGIRRSSARPEAFEL